MELLISYKFENYRKSIIHIMSYISIYVYIVPMALPRCQGPGLSPESPKFATPSLASEGSRAATNAVADPKELTPCTVVKWDWDYDM